MARRGAALQVVSDDYDLDLDAIQEFAEGLPERFLFCRELGHNWRPYTAGRYKDGGFERVLRCVRCKTRRIQVINHRGVVIKNKYEYAEGYQAPHGLGQIVGDGRGVLRLASINRIVSKMED